MTKCCILYPSILYFPLDYSFVVFLRSESYRWLVKMFTRKVHVTEVCFKLKIIVFVPYLIELPIACD